MLITAQVTNFSGPQRLALGHCRGPLLRGFVEQSKGWNGVNLVVKDSKVGSLVKHGMHTFSGQLVPYNDQPLGLYIGRGDVQVTLYKLISLPEPKGRTSKIYFRPFPTDTSINLNLRLSMPVAPPNEPDPPGRSLRLSMAGSNEPDPLDLSLGLPMAHSYEPDPLDLNLGLPMAHSYEPDPLDLSLGLPMAHSYEPDQPDLPLMGWASRSGQ
jgi:hypothetical protein